MEEEVVRIRAKGAALLCASGVLFVVGMYALLVARFFPDTGIG